MTDANQLEATTRDLIADIINRIHDDAAFKDAMIADAEGALEVEGFAARIDALADSAEEASEVAGFAMELGPIMRVSRQDLRNTTILASISAACSDSAGCRTERIVPSKR